MKRALLTLAVGLGVVCSLSWIDYGDKAGSQKLEFGKEFEGFSLMVSTQQTEFEQEAPEKIAVVLKNSNARSTLMPKGIETTGRRYALYIVVADKNGTALFSRNVLEKDTSIVAQGAVLPQTTTALAEISFDSLSFAKVEEYEYGMPFFDPKQRMVPAGQLVPQLYTMKAVLLSGAATLRPDFALSSNIWRILLLPKSAARMSDAEKKQKLEKYLAKMSEGAYGGIGVSSQLAALGEVAVDPVIRMAEKKGNQQVRESRIWAIVTLCGTRSPKAEEYILKRITDPVEFGDLAFLLWHSQGFHSQRITDTIKQLTRDIVTGQPLPWEAKHGAQSRKHGAGCLEWIFKHFVSIKETVGDEIAAGALGMGDPKIAAFALQAWKPDNITSAAAVVKPIFLDPGAHPNLKKSAMSCLAHAFAAQGSPAYDRTGDVDTQWHRFGMWLAGAGHFTPKETLSVLRCEIIGTRNADLRPMIITDLKRHARTASPVRSSQMSLPQDWIAAWEWALKTGTFDDNVAVRFLCNQMRKGDELDDSEKRALLIALKQRIGTDFPLASAKTVNLDSDWPSCGNWLIQNGYFGKPKRR